VLYGKVTLRALALLLSVINERRFIGNSGNLIEVGVGLDWDAQVTVND